MIGETVSIHQIHVGQKLIKLSQFKQISDMDVMACVDSYYFYYVSFSLQSHNILNNNQLYRRDIKSKFNFSSWNSTSCLPYSLPP